MSNEEMQQDEAVAKVVGVLCGILHGNPNIADAWVKIVTAGGVVPADVSRLTKTLIAELKAADRKEKEEKTKDRENFAQEISDVRRLAGLGQQGE